MSVDKSGSDKDVLRLVAHKMGWNRNTVGDINEEMIGG